MSENAIAKPRRRWIEFVVESLIRVVGVSSIGFVALIFMFLVREGVPFFFEVSPGKILSRCCPLSGIPELLLKECRSPIVDAGDAQSTRARLGTVLLRPQLDARPVSQDPQRLPKRDTLAQLHKLEHVTARFAPEAVEDLLIGDDVERRGLLFVKRA